MRSDDNKSEFYFFDTTASEKYYLNCGGAKQVVLISSGTTSRVGHDGDEINEFPIPQNYPLKVRVTDERLYVRDSDGRGDHIYVWVVRG
mgnify:FL=1